MAASTAVRLQAATTPRAKSITRYTPAVGRVLMGALFFLSGFNGLFHVFPEPTPQLPEAAMVFVGALVGSGYMLPLIMATQLIVGTLLLANRFVPLALVLLAPFIVNSMAFHIFLERSGLPMASLVLIIELYLTWVYRQAFRPVLQAQIRTSGAK